MIPLINFSLKLWNIFKIGNYFNIVIKKPNQQAHTLMVIIFSKKLGTM